MIAELIRMKKTFSRQWRSVWQIVLRLNDCLVSCLFTIFDNDQLILLTCAILPSITTTTMIPVSTYAVNQLCWGEAIFFSIFGVGLQSEYFKWLPEKNVFWGSGIITEIWFKKCCLWYFWWSLQFSTHYNSRISNTNHFSTKNSITGS